MSHTAASTGLRTVKNRRKKERYAILDKISAGFDIVNPSVYYILKETEMLKAVLGGRRRIY